MAQGPSDTILVAIRITLRIRESKVRNPDPPDRQRFVLSEHSFLVCYSFYPPRSDALFSNYFEDLFKLETPSSPIDLYPSQAAHLITA